MDRPMIGGRMANGAHGVAGWNGVVLSILYLGLDAFSGFSHAYLCNKISPHSWPWVHMAGGMAEITYGILLSFPFFSLSSKKEECTANMGNQTA
ncbi:hypothetical protein EV356DRAFT_23841 [Viridothelium virens]|uniref:Uncharacterized protein n=1 Tax=Viridothelium virens TaxID=1048519 RepID=A0A6A6GTR0_VIRVR|nr:hypothetical protein EV356DRAFT_23841 [Viridothelium virens]